MLVVFCLGIRDLARGSRRTIFFHETIPSTLEKNIFKTSQIQVIYLNKLFSSRGLLSSAFISANEFPVLCFLIHRAFNNFECLIIREMNPTASKLRTILVEFEF